MNEPRNGHNTGLEDSQTKISVELNIATRSFRLSRMERVVEIKLNLPSIDAREIPQETILEPSTV